MRRFISIIGALILLSLMAGALAACDLFGEDDSKPYEIITLLESSIQTAAAAFSPDGQHILFGRQEIKRETYFESIWLMDRDGSDIRKLVGGPGLRGPMVFSPDGSKVFYSGVVGSWNGFPAKDIFVVNVDGTGGKRLFIKNDGGQNDVVAISPDGRYILYNTWYGHEKGWRAQLANTDGTDQRQLTSFSSSAVGFSPDGSKILFGGVREGNADVYTVEIDGQNMMNLTAGPDTDESPTMFTPDGQRILFTSEAGVMLMNRDGTEKVLIAEYRSALAVDISPDGSRILYALCGGGSGTFCNIFAYYVVNIDKRTKIELRGIGRPVVFLSDSRHILLNSITGEGESHRYQISVAELQY